MGMGLTGGRQFAIILFERKFGEKNMELWKVVAISVSLAVGALIAICGLVLIRKFGKRNKNADKGKDDRTLIAENERDAAALVGYAKDNDALLDELRKIRERIKYLIPSEDGKIRDFDLKIKDLMEDLRIRFEKTEPNEPNKKIDSLLTQLKTTISERDARI